MDRLRTERPRSIAMDALTLSYKTRGEEMLTKRTFALVFGALLLFAVNIFGQDPAPIYPENYKVLTENDRVRVMDFKLRKGAKEDFHAHPAHVVYVLTGFKIMFKFPDG